MRKAFIDDVPLRKGRSFKLRQDSVKFPRTDQAAPDVTLTRRTRIRNSELPVPNDVEDTVQHTVQNALTRHRPLTAESIAVLFVHRP